MIYVYIKPEVKKNDITPMNAALNKTCIGRLYLNCYLVRGIFLVREMSNFFAAGQHSPAIYMVSPKGLQEDAGQSIPGGDNKQY